MSDFSPHTYVAILAGGGGTRLWPQSRRRRPKQFLPLLPGGETLLGATVRRTLALCPIERTLVVTAASQVEEVRQTVPDLPEGNILVEPIGRNTAPCIGLAALFLSRRDPQAVLAVLPSDHHIGDEPAFIRVLAAALSAAREGHVVTVGIRPTRPETGYGYIQVAGPDPAGEAGLYLVKAFVEKPDRDQAAAYLSAGTYLWNSGMFFFSAARILRELRTHLPALSDLLDELREHPERTAARYPQAPAISIDYAVMEKLGTGRAKNDLDAAAAIRVIEGDFGWNDVGSFAALADLHPGDPDHNHVLLDPVGPGDGGLAPKPVLLRSSGNIVWASTGQLVSTIGISDLVITVTEDAVLIMPREKAQEVRDVVDVLSHGGGERYL